MDKQAPPRLLIERSRRTNERRPVVVRSEERLLIRSRRTEVDEHLRDAPLPILIRRVGQRAVERVQALEVARVVAQPPRNRLDVLRALLARGLEIREIDVDADLRSGLLELVLEIGDASLQMCDLLLERPRTRIAFERLQGRTRRVVVGQTGL